MMLAQQPPTIMTPATSSTDDHSSSAADPLELDSGSSHRHSNQQRPLMMTMKRKRTKRPPPSAAAAASSSFSSGSGESTTTEEEDMAHCLILLASKPASPPQQQPTPCTPAVVDRTPPPPPPARIERYSSRKYTEAAATPDGARAGFYVYECKTCSKCFPTFQALGGHRASHKKPRVADDADAAATATATAKQQQPATTVAAPPPTPLTMTIQPPHQLDVITALSLNTTAAVTAVSKLRVHECSICGAEFASGQALGGHMRRHRPLNAPPPDRAIAKGADNKKEAGSAGTIVNLDLDLNLPAPSDSDDEEALSLHPPVVMLGLGQFNDGNKAGLVLTASALVDCHY